MARVFVIAEAGSNFKMGTPARDLEVARRMIAAAHRANAHAIKFQLYTSREVYVENAGYCSNLGEDIAKVFDDYALDRELVPAIAKFCDAFGTEFMCTAFSPDGVAFINPYVARHKIASYEIGYEALVRAAAHTGKPLIVSTGAATLTDIDMAVHWVFDENPQADLTLLHCIAAYPAREYECNLRGIQTLAQTYGPRGCTVGLSDHSRGDTAPIVAVALGAQVIEKHFTLCKELPGPDHSFALEPAELERMVDKILTADRMLGDGQRFEIQPGEQDLAQFAVRAVQATRDIVAGAELRSTGASPNMACLRPGNRTRGAPARLLSSLEGKYVTRAIAAGEGIGVEDVG